MSGESAGALLVSGRTRAGKTTLTRHLGTALRWPTASFSSYIREEARRRGMLADRRAMQDLGAELIVSLGWREFCVQMLEHARLAQSTGPLIVEGVRHLGTLDALRDLFAPAPASLIHLDVSDQERNRRLAQERVSAAAGAVWERHSTEREVLDGLPEAADLVVDADRSQEEVVNTVLAWLERSQHHR